PRETCYAAYVINHAYTLALYRADEKPRLADVSFHIGKSLVQSDPASAMDYFQRGILAGLDPQRVRQIGEIFESWAASRSSVRVSEPVARVAHVIGARSPEHGAVRHVKMLAASLNHQGVRSTIFTPDW